MAQKRTDYSVRLNKDLEVRKQIAILRMGGIPLRKIAKLTGRDVRTITNEVGRKEHKALVQRYVEALGRSKLPKELAAVVANALTEKEA